ncbi:hypothetical protein N7450_006387 [Penicillium hetheringtonii]|uniref:Uncharacterized protein n=1 Tax=Penicillium hetheringtonii TaxID=911720 RepID=A0AAD6DK94_9EURO|nr:hypothetical protein N7450_006387 [Penicillium hetheringtonii]
MFDEIRAPGFVFLPTDLQYFIDFEHADAKKRTVTMRARRVPTASDYRRYQEENGKIPLGKKGGLYQGVFLQPYKEQKILQAKTWHGEPIYAIRRAVIALTTPGINLLPPLAAEQLLTLMKLYFGRGPPTFPSPTSARSVEGNPESSKSPGNDQKDSHRDHGPYPGRDIRSPPKRGTAEAPPDNDQYQGSSPPKRQRRKTTGLDKDSSYQSTDRDNFIRDWLYRIDQVTEDVVREVLYVPSVA